MRNFFSVILFTLSFLFTLASPTAGPGIVAFYDGSFEQLKSKAHHEQKPYLLSFHDEGIPSRNLERFTYTNPQLANYIANNYLAMEFSIDNLNAAAEDLIDRYQVILFPTIVLFSPEGKMLYRFTGFTGDQAFIKMLETYRYMAETDMSMTFPPEPYESIEISDYPVFEFVEEAPTQSTSYPQTESYDFYNSGDSYNGSFDDFEITELVDLVVYKTPKKTEEKETITEISLVDDQLVMIDDQMAEPKTMRVLEETPAIISLPLSNLIIQTGVYSSLKNAEQEVERIKKNYSENVAIDPLPRKGKTLYRVRMGPFMEDQEATDMLIEYNAAEKHDAIIKTQ